jgi:hypothetical protein
MIIPGWLWLTWFAAMAGSFGVLEGVALHNRHMHDTLTGTWRRLVGVYPVNPRRRVLVPLTTSVFIAFVIWLVAHMDLGLWGGSGTS